MAHEQQATGPGGQVLFQPRHAVNVQVVGGLVHDEQVRGREQQAGEGDAHAPASRHLVHWPTVVRRVESQPGEDPVGVGLHGVPADPFEVRLGFAEVGQGPNLVGPGCLADPDSQGFDLVGQFRDGTGAQHHLLEDRPSGLGWQFLGQVADPEVPGAVDLAGVSVLDADDGLDQGRLAGAVPAHEGDPSARPQLQGRIREEGSGPEGSGQAGGGQHPGRVSPRRAVTRRPGSVRRRVGPIG